MTKEEKIGALAASSATTRRYEAQTERGLLTYTLTDMGSLSVLAQATVMDDGNGAMYPNGDPNGMFSVGVQHGGETYAFSYDKSDSAFVESSVTAWNCMLPRVESAQQPREVLVDVPDTESARAEWARRAAAGGFSVRVGGSAHARVAAHEEEARNHAEKTRAYWRKETQRIGSLMAPKSEDATSLQDHEDVLRSISESLNGSAARESYMRLHRLRYEIGGKLVQDMPRLGDSSCGCAEGVGCRTYTSPEVAASYRGGLKSVVPCPRPRGRQTDGAHRVFTRDEVLAVLRAHLATIPAGGADEYAVRHIASIFERME